MAQTKYGKYVKSLSFRDGAGYYRQVTEITSEAVAGSCAYIVTLAVWQV